MTRSRGVFTISLDFELHWGVRDVFTLDHYRENLLGVRAAAPALLALFEEYQVHATWATVGLLFFATREELLRGLPRSTPHYTNGDLSPYPHLDMLGANEDEDPFHYAPSLIRMIAATPHQEIANHTFSHYYCLEPGQTIDTFRADMEAAQRVAAAWGIRLTSLVFPRNQINTAYLDVCKEVGITAYRGNPSAWMYRVRDGRKLPLVARRLQFADTYANLSSHNGHSIAALAATFPYNIPASRFLRPYAKRFSLLEPLRLRRIRADLTHAARKGLLYHLWWHPHNFGCDTDRNLQFLTHILDHYRTLRERYGMESLNMQELSERLMEADARHTAPVGLGSPTPVDENVR